MYFGLEIEWLVWTKDWKVDGVDKETVFALSLTL